MTSQCPNEFPTTSAAYRIALVGESLGEREQALRRPFVGAAGAHLDRMLAGAGILRSACFVGNVTQVRPAGNDFNTLDWRGPEVQDGIAALLADLDRFAPYLVVTLGNVPLHLFRAGNVAPPWTMRAGKRVFNWPYKVTTWRGSLFAASPGVWRTDTRWTPAELALATANLPSPQDGANRREAGGSGLTSIIPSPSADGLSCGADEIALAAGEEPAVAAAVDAAGIGGTNAPPNQERGAAAPPPATDFHAGSIPRAGQSGTPEAARIEGAAVASRPAWKCLATLHPAYCLRAWAENFNLRQDLRRARTEGESSALVLPELDFAYGP